MTKGILETLNIRMDQDQDNLGPTHSRVPSLFCWENWKYWLGYQSFLTISAASLHIQTTSPPHPQPSSL